MIIGNKICELAEGMTIDVDGNTIEVKNTFGDQEALDKFIKEFDKRSLDKFPLIFVLIAKTIGEKMYSSKRQIVIMASTNANWLSKDRTANRFVKVIDPIYKKLIPIIDKDKQLKIVGDFKTRVEYTDKPNYGVSDSGISKKKSKESTITDYIDARLIDLEIEYRPNC